MKFIIETTSWQEKDVKPCKNAKSEIINEEECWVVEINSIDELLQLRDEVQDDLIIGIDSCLNMRTIIIYDAYIE